MPAPAERRSAPAKTFPISATDSYRDSESGTDSFRKAGGCGLSKPVALADDQEDFHPVQGFNQIHAGFGAQDADGGGKGVGRHASGGENRGRGQGVLHRPARARVEGV